MGHMFHHYLYQLYVSFWVITKCLRKEFMKILPEILVIGVDGE